MTDLHSCSFGCQRPACVHRQRDELWGYVSEIYDAVLQSNPGHRMTFGQVMEYAAQQFKNNQGRNNENIRNQANPSATDG